MLYKAGSPSLSHDNKNLIHQRQAAFGHLSPRLNLKGSHHFVAVMVAEKRALDTLTLAVTYLA